MWAEPAYSVLGLRRSGAGGLDRDPCEAADVAGVAFGEVLGAGHRVRRSLFFM